MLIGQFKNKVGDKNRVAFPKVFREELGRDLIITNGYEGCLVAVDKGRWENITKEIVKGSFIDKNIRDSGRFLLGGANEVSLDEQGRFVVPQLLFEYGDFDKEVVFVGLVNWVEIWDGNKWNERLNYVQEHGDEIAQRLSEITDQQD